MSFTREIAERSSALAYDDLPDDVVEVARQCLIDWFGVTVAGSQEPGTRILLDVCEARSDGGVTAVGHPARLSVADAALVNGTASHALDYDDVNEAMVGHPTVPIVGGLLALAESIGASGADVLCAFVAGYETECRVGRAIGVEHYQRGFHATGTIGTFGSAAACARLLGLDGPTTAVALGLAAAQAAGLKSMFGTMTKPLHAGKACANGVLAARLAAGGFTAAPDGIETTQGFAEAAGGGGDAFDAERGLRAPRNGWFIRDNLFKYHAACFQTHSSIEGLRRLRESGGFAAGDIASATVHTDAMQLRMCAIPEPQTGLEVKFSLRHTAALALLGRDTSAIDTYTDECASDAEVLALRERVNVADDGQVGGPTPVDVTLRDGRRLQAAHDVSTPEPDLAKQRALLQDKCTALVSPVLGRDVAAELVAELDHVDKVNDIAGLMRKVAR